MILLFQRMKIAQMGCMCKRLENESGDERRNALSKQSCRVLLIYAGVE